MQAILCGAVQEAQANDYNIMLVNTEMRPDFERAGILELLRRGIDGLVLLPTYVNILEEEYQLLARRRSPIVIAGNYYEHLKELDTVIPGHDQGAKLILEHLFELGHRQIGFIFGVMRKPLGSERFKIYCQMLEEMNIPFRDEFVLQCGITYQDGFDATNALLDLQPRPTAILAINDLLALGAMHAAHQKGLNIPEDVSIAGFDDNDYSAFLNPSLTTVDVSAHEIGTQCVRMVLERIKNPERPYRSHRIPPALKMRSSTGPVKSVIPLPAKQEMEVQSNDHQPNNYSIVNL